MRNKESAEGNYEQEKKSKTIRMKKLQKYRTNKMLGENEIIENKDAQTETCLYKNKETK